jgi:type II secretory pathway pseudopilin PulG
MELREVAQMPVKNRTAPPRDLKNVAAQRGVTRFEMATVVMLVGLLAAPLIALAPSSLQATRTGMTEIALERARNALIEYAAANGGCLPFAADFEGGLPDSTQGGIVTSGSADTGVGVEGENAGDLPWADLGLVKSFLDGNQLRVQYYVAPSYTDNNGIGTKDDCGAGFRGFEWEPSVTYTGSPSDPAYVYYTPSGSDRRLYQIVGTLPAGTPPDTVVGTVVNDVTATFPAAMLALRRGPDVVVVDSQSDVLSARNVFVLIAPGENRNTNRDRTHIRDANHLRNTSGAAWPLNFSFEGGNSMNEVIFSATPNIDPTDSGNDGDDTLLVMSFINYKAALSKYGLNMEPVCDFDCEN